MTRFVPLLVFLLCAFAGAARADDARLHHDLDVRLDPAGHRIEAVDRLRVPASLLPASGPLEIRLHAGLELEAEGWTLERGDAPEKRGGAPSRAWRLSPGPGRTWPAEGDLDLVLRYAGEIHHPLEQESEEYARSFSRTVGTIGEDGVVLTRASWWVPTLGEDDLTFRLAVTMPRGWTAVSQGARIEREGDGEVSRVVWDCPHPMEEVYLIGGTWTEYARRAGRVEAQAFLREPDEALANRYLEATDMYLGMYERLIGPYPFRKFALVENFWETGYGMPSFTLLGPRVIRFPFILHSSYPHEILHNWWGNSVYVAWEKGNWCEGLTAYMADHLIKEGREQGATYRRDSLKKYRSYVKRGRDFPLVEFRSRHSSATEAVGYGKALMVFHMLRQRMGDDAFRAALQAFYRDQLWRRASWADLADAFSEASGEDVRDWVRTWTTRVGAPALALEAETLSDDRLRLRLVQTQEGDPWPVDVPVAVTVEGRDAALEFVVPMRDREATVEVDTPGRALRVDADPAFDVFRRLDLPETPPTLGEVFGADQVTIVVPAPGADPLAEAWGHFARSWQRGGARGPVEIVREDAIEALPADRAVWVLGASNRWGASVREALARVGAGQDATVWRLGADRVPRQGHGVVTVVRHPDTEELAMGWVATEVEASLPGLARKLPHYGKYSYLAFEGDEPTNVAKGEWPPAGSPLSVQLGDTDAPRARLAPRGALARPAPLFEASRLMAHVRTLADDAMEGRGAGTAGLDRAADYVAEAFARAGLEPAGDAGGFLQAFDVPDGPEGRTVRLANVVGVLPGRDPALADKVLVVGAHYDHLGYGWPDVRRGHEGKIHNGADDNASGVAVLIELAHRLVEGPRPARSILFVAFSGEEWGLKGSRHLVAQTSRWPLSEAVAMVNLDTVGRLGEDPLMVLGTGGATEWPHIVRGVGFTTGIRAKAVPDDPEGSDQVAFREIGVPAVQLFTGAHEDYHRSTDDVAKIDGEGLVKVATWARETLAYLADRPTPLTKTGDAAGPAAASRPREGRKVLFGTVPAFDFGGPGVKVESVVAGSPAEKAGIRAGDVLVAMDGEPLPDLRAYAKRLRAYEPGAAVQVRVRRGGEEIELDAVLEAR